MIRLTNVLFALLVLLAGLALPVRAEQLIEELNAAAYKKNPKAAAEDVLIYARQIYERILKEKDYFPEQANRQREYLDRKIADLAKAKTPEQRKVVEKDVESAKITLSYHQWVGNYHNTRVLGSPEWLKLVETYKTGLKQLEDSDFANAYQSLTASLKGMKKLHTLRKAADEALRRKFSCEEFINQIDEIEGTQRNRPEPLIIQDGRTLYLDGCETFENGFYFEANRIFEQAGIKLRDGVGVLVESGVRKMP